MKRLAAALLTLTACAGPVFADFQARMVRDIDPRTQALSSSPRSLGAVGPYTILLGAALDDDSTNVWSTDGTRRGTKLLANVAGTDDYTWTNGSQLLFVAGRRDTENSGFAIWATRGTPETTFPLTDDDLIVDCDSPYHCYYPGVVWDARFGRWLIAADTRDGNRYFVSDGTREGTESWGIFAGGWFFDVGGRLGLAEVATLDSGFAGVRIHVRRGGALETTFEREGRLEVEPQAVGNRAVFVFVRRDARRELWSIAPTVGNARRLSVFEKDVEGIGGMTWERGPATLRRFWVRRSVGSRVVATDGSRRGTRTESIAGLGEVPSRCSWLSIGSRTLCTAVDEPTGTVTLWSIDAGSARRLGVFLRAGFQLLSYGPHEEARAYFLATSGMSGTEPWVTDGTKSGTRFLGDLCPGPCSTTAGRHYLWGREHLFTSEQEGGGVLWRTAGARVPIRLGVLPGWSWGDLSIRSDSVEFRSGHDVWFTRGREGDVRLRGSLPLGTEFVDFLADSNRVLVKSEDEHRGVEPASFEFLTGALRPLRDLRPGRAGLGSLPLALATAGERAVFLNGSASELWSSDGTDSGTIRLVSLDAPCSYGQPGPRDRWSTASGSLVYFSCGSRVLWATDGSVPGTTKLLEMPARTEGSIWGTTPLDFGVVLVAGDVDGDELWFSDGSLAGTRPLGVRDLYPVGSVPSRALLSNALGEGLWSVDSTGRLEVLRADAYGEAFPWRGEAVFPLDTAGPPRLFASDGTPEGTRELEMGDLGPRVEYLNPVGVVGSDLLILVGQRSGGLQLIASDGTAIGTRMLLAIGEGFETGAMTAIGGVTFFNLESWPAGVVLWRTDGTREGTKPVIEVPGFRRSQPMVAFGSKLLFERQTWPDRSEVWQTDGTREGSRPVPGLSTERLFDYAVVGDRLFLESQDLAHGSELWVVEDGSADPIDE